MSTSRKLWSYRQITDSTKKAIERLQRLHYDSDDEAQRQNFRCFAYGTYAAWTEITWGWQNAGDDAEMKQLAKLERKNLEPKENC